MNIEGVKLLMQEVRWGVLASTDGTVVGVRPMGSWAWMDDELWCATSPASDKAVQIGKVRHAEYCFARPDGEHVRISGPCIVSGDITVKTRLFDALPSLKKHHADAGDPNFAVIVMKPDRIRYRGVGRHGYEEISQEAGS